jgi:acid stress-induced BolA-like protein IbaG/YrbA
MVRATYDYEALVPAVRSALEKAFPESAIELTKSYGGHIHVLLVSRALNGMGEREKQQYVWDMLQTELAEESQAVSMVIAYSTDELK